MRIAIATQDRLNVNGHFGSARIFQFFELGGSEPLYLEEFEFQTVSAEDGNHQGEAEDRLAHKIDALKGTALLFVTGIGGPVSNRVSRANVHPIKLSAEEPIPSLLSRIQVMIQGDNPPMWLRRVIAADGDLGCDSYTADG
jgi:nitrogen fixation protein NifX